jgi:hypothetical protein
MESLGSGEKIRRAENRRAGGKWKTQTQERSTRT